MYWNFKESSNKYTDLESLQLSFVLNVWPIIQLEKVMHEAEKCYDDPYLFQYLEMIRSVLQLFFLSFMIKQWTLGLNQLYEPVSMLIILL